MTNNRLEILKRIYTDSSVNRALALSHAIDIITKEYEAVHGQDVSWVRNAFEESFLSRTDKEEKDLALGYMVLLLTKNGCSKTIEAIRAVSEWRTVLGERASVKTVEAAFTSVKQTRDKIGLPAFDKDAYLAILPMLLSEKDSFPTHYKEALGAYNKVKSDMVSLAELISGSNKLLK